MGRGRPSVAIAILIAGLLPITASAQTPFLTADDTVSHRVIEPYSGLGGQMLPSFIRNKLMRKLQDHIQSGNHIDHKRLSQILQSLPLDEQSRNNLENLAKVLSPEKSDANGSLPEHLQTILGEDIRKFLSNEAIPNDLSPNDLDQETLTKLLESNRPLADSFKDLESTFKKDPDKFKEIAQQFDSNSREIPPDSSKSKRRQTRPHRANSNPEDDGLSKKLLESAFEAMDKSSMEFLKASQTNGKPFDLAWIANASRSWNKNINQLNRKFEQASAQLTRPKLPAMPPGNMEAESGIGLLGITIAFCSLVLLLGILFRIQLRRHPATVAAQRLALTSNTNIVDRASLVAEINSIAAELYGRTVAYQHHGLLFSKLQQVDPSFNEIAPIYVQCRYAPDDMNVNDAQILSVRELIERIRRRGNQQAAITMRNESHEQ